MSLLTFRNFINNNKIRKKCGPTNKSGFLFLQILGLGVFNYEYFVHCHSSLVR